MQKGCSGVNMKEVVEKTLVSVHPSLNAGEPGVSRAAEELLKRAVSDCKNWSKSISLINRRPREMPIRSHSSHPTVARKAPLSRDVEITIESSQYRKLVGNPNLKGKDRFCTESLTSPSSLWDATVTSTNRQPNILFVIPGYVYIDNVCSRRGHRG